MKHVISVSGGKDSTATLLLALERMPRESVLPVFADTGSEHEAVYSYLEYLEQRLDIRIHRLRADFSEQIAAKRLFIARDRRRHSLRWTNKAKRRALAVLHPTGVPFLDLCLWKGRFPSRKAQFCTQELKTLPLVEYQLGLVDSGEKVISWQGVRRDESANRRDAKLFERVGPNLYHYRPIVSWNAQQVFDFCTSRGVEPNPLYKQGMGRVGCMPCINTNKMEMREIGARFPEHIDRIAEWERLVCQAGKRNFATFFASTNSPVEMKGLQDRQIFERGNVYKVVEWSKTTRGGKQYDILADQIEPTACSSAYGLCE